MDWTTVILAGLGGGLGGALGSGIIALMGSRASNTYVRTIIAVVFVVLGARMGPQLMEPYLGPTLRDVTGQTNQFEQQLDKIMAEPLFQAFVEGDPQTEETIRRRLREAYKSGGVPALTEEAKSIGQEYGPRVFTRFVPRARDQDLTAFATAFSAVALKLRETEPALCYTWMFQPEQLDTNRFRRVVGQERREALHKALANIISFAGEDPVVFDRDEATRANRAIVQGLLAKYHLSVFTMVAGQRLPQNDEDKAQMCGLAGDLYARMAAHAQGPSILRMLLGPNEAILAASTAYKEYSLGSVVRLTLPVDSNHHEQPQNGISSSRSPEEKF